MTELHNLGLKYRTDKAWLHNYCYIYEQYLSSRRLEVKNILEIGVCEGGSLKMWGDYFPNANILGLDIEEKWLFKDDRINCILGDASDAKWLKDNIKIKFDLIIDDGSHNSFDINNTFLTLFSENLSNGGIYIMEDLHATYESHHNKIESKSTVEFLSSLIDELNWHDGKLPASGDWRKCGEPKNIWQRYIEFIHFYKSVAVIAKRV